MLNHAPTTLEIACTVLVVLIIFAVVQYKEEKEKEKDIIADKEYYYDYNDLE
jgi:cell division protein FtsN